MPANQYLLKYKRRERPFGCRTILVLRQQSCLSDYALHYFPCTSNQIGVLNCKVILRSQISLRNHSKWGELDTCDPLKTGSGLPQSIVSK